MTVDRTDNNLARFQYSAPAWWAGFNTGRRDARVQAQSEAATWEAVDWQRGALATIKERTET
jgi:hypothetical protein